MLHARTSLIVIIICTCILTLRIGIVIGSDWIESLLLTAWTVQTPSKIAAVQVRNLETSAAAASLMGDLPESGSEAVSASVKNPRDGFGEGRLG